MIDPFGRHISYLRVSVTDRCDFRCVYCMSEHMTFLPKAEMLTLEELERACAAFIRKGVERIRITGGEPLVRRNVMHLFEGLGRRLEDGSLKELTLTTNGSQLARFARELADVGVQADQCLARHPRSGSVPRHHALGRLDEGHGGHRRRAGGRPGGQDQHGRAEGRQRRRDCLPMLEWAHGRGMDLTLIETMPLGEIDEDRTDRYLPLSQVRAALARRYTLEDSAYTTGGPARYVRVAETGGRLGFITPLTHNFCESCNRVRFTCTGTLYMCLGQNDAADLRAPLRASADDALAGERRSTKRSAASPRAMISSSTAARRAPAVARHMSLTGG